MYLSTVLEWIYFYINKVWLSLIFDLQLYWQINTGCIAFSENEPSPWSTGTLMSGCFLCTCLLFPRWDGSHGGLHSEAGHRYSQWRKLDCTAGISLFTYCTAQFWDFGLFYFHNMSDVRIAGRKYPEFIWGEILKMYAKSTYLIR